MQSFFLATQERGYYVLNDTFRYMEPLEHSISKSFSTEFSQSNATHPPNNVTHALPQQYGGHHEVSILTDARQCCLQQTGLHTQQLEQRQSLHTTRGLSMGKHSHVQHKQKRVAASYDVLCNLHLVCASECSLMTTGTPCPAITHSAFRPVWL